LTIRLRSTSDRHSVQAMQTKNSMGPHGRRDLQIVCSTSCCCSLRVELSEAGGSDLMHVQAPASVHGLQQVQGRIKSCTTCSGWLLSRWRSCATYVLCGAVLCCFRTPAK
jgi:hypothetical protein